MKVDIVSIAKKERSLYDPLNKELMKMSSRFAIINDIELFTKDVTKAHTIGPDAAQSAYTKVLEPHLDGAFTIALHPAGKI
ncbi:MAG: 23S rRNA (pseudouridine(1915)-N(3))-methyltransferase RlmH, partial [Helicobacteraceae bacterium]|nr:23S rRNA (pseudouridine(1915)-N(3))-methyltransferase RlmH [Helicobacteraceae bacterium]